MMLIIGYKNHNLFLAKLQTLLKGKHYCWHYRRGRWHGYVALLPYILPYFMHQYCGSCTHQCSNKHVGRIVCADIHAAESHSSRPCKGGHCHIPFGVYERQRGGCGKGYGGVARWERGAAHLLEAYEIALVSHPRTGSAQNTFSPHCHSQVEEFGKHHFSGVVKFGFPCLFLF